MIEIERKFLVTSAAYRNEARTHRRIIQGYLASDPERTVRVRIKGSQAYLTVKGKSNDLGTSRFEWETPISVEDAESLMALCEPTVIEKIRFDVPIEGHLFEVDEFAGENHGLVVAEVELTDELQSFPRPAWLGVEVTGDPRYYNARLSREPFMSWTG